MPQKEKRKNGTAASIISISLLIHEKGLKLSAINARYEIRKTPIMVLLKTNRGFSAMAD